MHEPLRAKMDITFFSIIMRVLFDNAKLRDLESKGSILCLTIEDSFVSLILSKDAFKVRRKE
jgi:hypothetical protein